MQIQQVLLKSTIGRLPFLLNKSMKEGPYQHGAWHLKEALKNVNCCNFIIVATAKQGMVYTKYFLNLKTILQADKLVFLLLSLLIPEEKKKNAKD